MTLRSVPFILALAAYAQAPAVAPIRGFTPDQWKAQHDREEQAKAIPQAERLRIYMDRIAAKPHHAGSPGSKAVADYLSTQLTEWGLDTRIETFQALIPYPTTRTLEMTAPVRFRAKLAEPPIPEDPTTAQDNQLPTFNAYGASGDVTAPLVYANYGQPEDFEYLKKQGIDVKGKIAIVRYGRSWRGLKPKLAQDNGAVGCLIYSDPREDGFFQNDVYPRGPMRPADGVQRGSVMDMAIYPGDPLSPGWASEPGSKRLNREDARTLLKIPVLPISWADALPLLQQLNGPVVPESWRGALPLTYHAGPGPATVHLQVDFDWSTRPLYDVIATIPGSVEKDQWIIYGNHHDAWVNGASDPVSGASVLLETARTLSTLRKQGWQPRRTIMLALWDGEEYGLLGSTEWVEKHMDQLDRSGAVYINSDSTGRGPLVSGGSASLEPFLSEVLRDVTDPSTSKSLLEAARERQAPASTSGATSSAPTVAPEPRDRGFHLESLGSGSDYVAFLDHAGIASLNLGFGAGDGVYHSIYDTPAWYQQFSDGDRTFAKALTQVMTTAMLRLADAPVLPFDFGSLSASVTRWVEEIRKDLPHGNAKPSNANVDLRPIAAQLTRLSAAAKAYDEELSAWTKRAGTSAPERLESEKLAKVDESIRKTERALLTPDGLPRRDWYRSQIYAPGILTGYSAKTLPGVREAVEAQHWDEANQQTRKLAEALRAAASQVEEAAHLLKQAQ
ncbi:MAG: Transferrin receptor domain protein dimerization region [Bryobacterales bacterium]|nr:Transferrin receptor domain protein dimerization region [Bryobacterales bacterium]